MGPEREKAHISGCDKTHLDSAITSSRGSTKLKLPPPKRSGLPACQAFRTMQRKKAWGLARFATSRTLKRGAQGPMQKVVQGWWFDLIDSPCRNSGSHAGDESDSQPPLLLYTRFAI